MTAATAEVPPRRHLWDLVADHVAQRGSILGPSTHLVYEDMRARAAIRITEPRVDRPLFEGRCCPAHVRADNHHSVDCPSRDGRGYVWRAYEKTLDLIGLIAAELEAHGASFDDPIDVRAPASSRLVHLQAMLWSDVRTAVQLRTMIGEVRVMIGEVTS